jgi:hypothetical protein
MRVAPSDDRTASSRREASAGELHVHHVDARDEQHADAEAEHRVHGAAQRPRRERIDQPLHLAGVELLVRVRVVLGQPLGERRELRVGLVERNAGLERAEDRGIDVRGVVAGPRRKLAEERQPQLFVDRKGKALGHDADDRRGLAVDANVLADDVLGSPEVALPDAVANQRHFLGAGLVILGGEVAAHDRSDAEARQELLGRIGAGVPLWLAIDGDVDRRAVQVG